MFLFCFSLKGQGGWVQGLKWNNSIVFFLGTEMKMKKFYGTEVLALVNCKSKIRLMTRILQKMFHVLLIFFNFLINISFFKYSSIQIFNTKFQILEYICLPKLPSSYLDISYLENTIWIYLNIHSSLTLPLNFEHVYCLFETSQSLSPIPFYRLRFLPTSSILFSNAFLLSQLLTLSSPFSTCSSSPWPFSGFLLGFCLLAVWLVVMVVVEQQVVYDSPTQKCVT